MVLLTCPVTIRQAGKKGGKSPKKPRGGDNGLVPTSGPQSRLGGRVRLEATRFPRNQPSIGHTGAFCKGNASPWLLTASLPDVRPIPPKEATEPKGASWNGVLL